MSITWNPSLSVGLENIDSQHKILFEKIDNLIEAGKNRKSKEVIGETLDFLEDYTKEHFRDEEVYMEKIKYPQIEQQKAAHRHFIGQLADLKKEYNDSGYNLVIIIKANQMIVNWLTQHILIMDKQIGSFVQNQ